MPNQRVKPSSGLPALLRISPENLHCCNNLNCADRCYPQADYAYYGTDQTYIRDIKISAIFSPATMQQPLAGLGGRLHRNTQAGIRTEILEVWGHS